MGVYFLMKVRRRDVGDDAARNIVAISGEYAIDSFPNDGSSWLRSCAKSFRIISDEFSMQRSLFQPRKIWHRNTKIFCIDVYNETYRRLDVVFFNQNIFSSAMINRDNYLYVLAISEVTRAILWRRHELLRELGRSYLATHVNVLESRESRENAHFSFYRGDMGCQTKTRSYFLLFLTLLQFGDEMFIGGLV